ncbi:aminotransferase class I/II-fold pyridoxal phosphate-dependent enzyme [Tumebacillus flagellatus]|uniref:methionine gamma-lyase family protein n=1 Tax=Tumebacillus flagellatus TaxID=1157490 RepID=UPI0006904E46|nr:methionine gamma-lyase family protein [Tumebacillus flagellatus]
MNLLKDPAWMQLASKIEAGIADQFRHIEDVALYNQAKVLQAFQEEKVADFHFASSTGYGHNDAGRETLEVVYAKAFGAQSALLRPHIVSGTHAISLALYGVLRPGDELLYITGKPYDTLEEVIGVRGEEGEGSLREFGVGFDFVPLTEAGKVNYEEVARKIKPNTKMIGIQRSAGYSWRSSFPVAEIGEMIKFVKEIKPDVVVFVDNCYGEFTEKTEPTEVGADLVVGSLIKNPGGGLAPSGGYVVGRADLVHRASCRLTSPGIGAEQGAMLGTNRALFQGFFLAPHIVGEALKGAVFAAALFEELGMVTHPSAQARRTDIIQAVRLGTRERLIGFCQSIQSAAPVDSHVNLEPWAMPGYADEVIMAAGAFIQGSSIELSADGPIREPFIGFMQGGLTYQHTKIAVLSAVANLKAAGHL